MNKYSKIRSAAALAVLTATTAGLVVAEQGNNARAAVPAAPAVASPIAAATDFSAIVKRYGPAVVNISVVGQARQVPTGQAPADDLFSQLIPGWPGMPGMPGMPPGGQAPMQRGQGSGFIVSQDGLILTNAHVVDGADEVTVKLSDRREFKAKVLGADRMTDVAVLRIEAGNLPTVKLGDPSAVQVGEPVLAIGSPFGFESSASAGIVSAMSRSLPNETLVPFIQTDVALNPGNSGGPLFNARGEVIGINSQIYSRTGGYQGLSFAIPIDTANQVQQQLVKHGKVTRGRLGVAVQDLSQPLAQGLGLESISGALVSSVEKGGPAETAGLQAGDVIVNFNGNAINRSSELPARVAAAAPGSTNKVEVLRDGKRLSLDVKVASLDHGGAPAGAAKAQGKLGLSVRPLNPAESQQAGVPSGLVVEQSGGPARRSGIQPGDIVLSVNGKRVTGVEQMRELVEKGGRQLAILVQRDGSRLFVPVQLG